MRLITPDQMREIDRRAIEEIGIPGAVLMENAAIQVAMKAAAVLTKNKGSQAVVLAGTGNNGGDALAVTRHLLAMGFSVMLFTYKSSEAYTGDAKINADILDKMGVEMHCLWDQGQYDLFESALSVCDLVIDGLFGTGLNRDLDSTAKKVIRSVNTLSRCTLSIDIPSGLDGLTGKIRGDCIRADYTVTFFLPKTGMVQYPAAQYLGELTVADISIPYALADGLDTLTLLDRELILPILPKRPRDSHKGSFGRVLAIAGSFGMTGAAGLAAGAAYRTGSGLVRLAVPSGLVPTLASMIPEAVFTPLEEYEGAIGAVDDAFLSGLMENSDSVLVGPGLSNTPFTGKLVRKVITLSEKPLVVDADGLNLLAHDKEVLKQAKAPVILTPHPAEMARLIGAQTQIVQEHRTGIAAKFAREYGVIVVLKGAGTVVAAPDGRISINPTGNSGMATAGSGDVLTGMIASFLGQNLPPYEAALAGVYLHGLAGDLAEAETGQAGMMASDLVRYIASAVKSIQ